MQRILALDPAARTGFAHTNGQHGVWILGDTDGHRLKNLEEFMLDAAKAWGIDLIACEDSGFGAGARQLHTMAMHNELRGIIKLVAAKLMVPVVKYVPASIKAFACGNGHAPKDQVMASCKTLLGIEPATSDEADALWILEMAKQGYVVQGKATKKRAERAWKKKQPKLFK